MITHKKCKGQGKAKGFGCGETIEVRYRKYGLGTKCGCYQSFLIGSDEGKAILERSIISSKKKLETKKRKESRERKEALIDYKKKLQSEVQRISRLIDIGLPCLAKGVHSEQIHGGHVYSRGSNSSMSFNIHNIHRQSAQSNHFQNDDGLLRSGLINEYGQEYFEFLTALQRTPALKYINEEYKAFYRLACSITRDLQRGGGVFTKSERIEKRNEINLKLGIYEKEYCIYEKPSIK